MVFEVGDLGTELDDRSSGEEAVEFLKGLDPGLDVVETVWVELLNEGSFNQRNHLLLFELHQRVISLTITIYKNLGFQ